MNRQEQKFDQLRVLAQALTVSNDLASKREFSSLLQEIQRYQSELERQNDALKRAHDALQRSKQELSDLFDNAPNAYFVVDGNGVIQLANLTAVTKFGLTRQALIGKPFANLVTVNDRVKYEQHHRRLIQSQQPQQLEAWFESEVTSNFYGRMESIVIETDESTNTYRIAITDITERKQYETRLQLLFKLDGDILGQKSLREIATTALKALVHVTDSNYVSLTFFGENKDAIAFTSQLDRSEDVCEQNVSDRTLQALSTMKSTDYHVMERPDFLPNDVLDLYPIHVFVPIQQDEKLKGIINLGTDFFSNFDQQQIAFAQQVAMQIGIAVNQSELSEQVEQYTNELRNLVEERTLQLEKSQLREQEERLFAEVMLSMVKQLNQSLDLEHILEHMLANLKRILSYDSAEIAILNDDKLNLISQIRSTLQPEFISKLTHDKRIEEHPLYLQMQQTGKPILINDMSSASASITQDMGHQVKSFLGIPIISNDETLGFINVYKHEAGFFSQKDIQHLEAFAEHASLSIKNARLYQTAQELAVLKERQRLASDLHDSVSQVIFSLCITAESQARMIEKGDYAQVKALSEILRLSAANVHAEMSLLMLELRPMSLSTSTLADLLKQLVIGTLGRYTSVEIETVIEKTPTLAIEPKNAIFRILQEALNNVVKHAGAEKVTVKLLSQDDTIHLTIEDDGHGFDPETQAPGIGLHIMRERATKIGSELKIKSSKDKGTCITLTYQIP